MEIRRFLPVCLLILASLSALSAQSSKPLVSGIKASQSASETTVSWSAIPESQTDAVTSLYVYRSSEPVFSPETLSSLAPVAVLTPNMTSWHENPDSTLYYYAVVARLSDGSLYDLLIPNVNTTLRPATVAQAAEEEEEPEQAELAVDELSVVYEGLRIKPLPSFRIFNTVSGDQSQMTAEALSAALDFGIEGNRKDSVSLYIAEADLAENATGDTYLLHDIVSRYMLRNNWNRAKEELTALTQTWHSEEITARINLYLGQCSYFTMDYLEALQYFLHSEALYPDVSKIWIQATINAFDLPDLSK